MIGNGWVLAISGIRINAQYPVAVHLEISPGEKALLDKGVIGEQELAEAYRDAIERGSFRHYSLTGWRE